MPSWQGKSQGTTTGYRIFVQTLRIFGLWPAYLLLRCVAAWYLLVPRPSTTTAFRFYRHRMNMPTLRAIWFVYRNYYAFGQSILDRLVVMSGMPNRFSFDFDGETYLHEMVRRGKGGLLLSAHIGNWEIAGHLLQRINTKIHIVMFDGEHERIKEYLANVTGGRNVDIIVIRNDLSHVYAITEALRNNGLVCMHADRFVGDHKTFSRDFLGSPARFPAGPFLLAAGFRVPFSFVFAMKETPRHYHFFATPLEDNFEGAKQAMAERWASSFVTEMEQKVRAWPEQWYNFYDFWKA